MHPAPARVGRSPAYRAGVADPPAEVEAAIYRIVQEAVADVVRDARATIVDVDLTVDQEAATVQVRQAGSAQAAPGTSSHVAACARVARRG